METELPLSAVIVAAYMYIRTSGSKTEGIKLVVNCSTSLSTANRVFLWNCRPILKVHFLLFFVRRLSFTVYIWVNICCCCHKINSMHAPPSIPSITRDVSSNKMQLSANYINFLCLPACCAHCK